MSKTKTYLQNTKNQKLKTFKRSGKEASNQKYSEAYYIQNLKNVTKNFLKNFKKQKNTNKNQKIKQF